MVDTFGLSPNAFYAWMFKSFILNLFLSLILRMKIKEIASIFNFSDDKKGHS